MLIVEFVLENTESRARQLTLSAVLYFDVRPVWLADAVGLHDAADELRFDAATRTLVGTDSKHAWSVPDGWNMRFVHTTSHTHGTSPCNPNQQPGTALPVCWNITCTLAPPFTLRGFPSHCVASPCPGSAELALSLPLATRWSARPTAARARTLLTRAHARRRNRQGARACCSSGWWYHLTDTPSCGCA